MSNMIWVKSEFLVYLHFNCFYVMHKIMDNEDVIFNADNTSIGRPNQLFQFHDFDQTAGNQKGP